MAADPPEPPRRHFNLKPKDAFGRANAPDVAQTPSAGHDVVTWRQDAITFDQKAGLNNLKPTGARPNGRRRDFLILVGIVDGFFAALALTGFMKGNAVLLGGSLIGMGLFTVTLAWVMWGVMSRY